MGGQRWEETRRVLFNISPPLGLQTWEASLLPLSSHSGD